MYSISDAGTLLGVRTMPTYHMLSMTFKKLPFNERALIMRDYLKNEDKMIKFLHRGGWGVLVADAGSTERILSDTATFPKLIVSELNPQSAYGQFMGVNVVESNHSTWKHHRRIVSPPFRHQFDPEIIMKLSWKLHEVIDSNIGNPLEVFPIIQNLAVDALGLALLNIEFNSLLGDQSEFLKHYNEFAKGFIKPLYYLFPKLDSIYNPFRLPIFYHLNQINKYLKKLTQQRRQELSDQNIQRTDLLSLMIKASEKDLHWSDIEIQNNIRIFFAAGHDTTSNSLTMALYCLAKYPETQSKARKEVLDILGKDTHQVPTHESLQSLHYLTAVIKETLRLYPSLSILQERIASQDTCLQGHLIPKGTILMIHMYLLHRDPDYWGSLSI